MPSMGALLEAWAESDKLLDRLLAEMEPVFLQARRDLLGAMSSLPKASNGTLRKVKSAALFMEHTDIQANIAAQIAKLSSRAGSTAGPMLAELGLNVIPISRRAQLTFATQSANAVKDVLGSFNRGLAGLLTQATTTPFTQKELSTAASLLLDVPIGQARTIANTTLAGLQRQTTAQAASGLPKGEEVWWVYTGPEDSITRPFCHALVGKAISSRDLSKLRNGQGLSVKSHGGGYNCRHSINPASETYVTAARIPKATSSDISRANRVAKV